MMVKKQTKKEAPHKHRIGYAVLFSIIVVALIVQVVVLIPLLIINLPTMYAVSEYGAISTVLSQFLMFLIFLGAIGAVSHKFHGN